MFFFKKLINTHNVKILKEKQIEIGLDVGKLKNAFHDRMTSNSKTYSIHSEQNFLFKNGFKADPSRYTSGEKHNSTHAFPRHQGSFRNKILLGLTHKQFVPRPKKRFTVIRQLATVFKAYRVEVQDASAATYLEA